MKVFHCDYGFVIFPFGSVSFCFLCLGVVSFRYMNIYRISVYWPIYLFGVTFFGCSSVSSDVKTTTLTFLCFFSVWYISSSSFFLSILLFLLYLKYIYYFSLLVVFLLFNPVWPAVPFVWSVQSFLIKCRWLSHYVKLEPHVYIRNSRVLIGKSQTQLIYKHYFHGHMSQYFWSSGNLQNSQALVLRSFMLKCISYLFT